MKELMHYQFPGDKIQLDGTIAKLTQKIAAVVEDTGDDAIVAAILAAARAEEVTDLYLLDKTFILEAIREKRERETLMPLTIDDLRQMHGEPVWIADSQCWGIVSVDDGGPWKDKPFVTGVTTRWGDINFSWDVEKRELTCYRHKPKEE